MPKKIWIIAGEESGDMYGARLITALKSLAPSLEIQCMGGREMKSTDAEILVDSTELGVVGLIEVLKHYTMFRRIFFDLVKRASVEQPDLVILIDYPGFNLRFAEKLHQAGIKIFYYISPQVWAWGARRIPKIARYVTKMMVIFPFEKDIYRKVGLDTTFVGHPLVHIMRDEIDNTLKREDYLILLLPGSRDNEVDRLLVPMVETACRLYEKNNKYRFVISLPRESIKLRVEEILDDLRGQRSIPCPFQVEYGQTEKWMQKAAAGIAASGTVTVQGAIFGLPMVVIYRVNPFTYWVGSLLIRIRYITMINLIADRVVFEEFIQHRVKPSILLPALERIVPDGERRQEVVDGMASVVGLLEGETDASMNAATVIARYLGLIAGT